MSDAVPTSPTPPGPTPPDPQEVKAGLAGQPDHEAHHAPGTFVLALIFLLSFAVYYFANWKALADVWHVR